MTHTINKVVVVLLFNKKFNKKQSIFYLRFFNVYIDNYNLITSLVIRIATTASTAMSS